MTRTLMFLALLAAAPLGAQQLTPPAWEWPPLSTKTVADTVAIYQLAMYFAEQADATVGSFQLRDTTHQRQVVGTYKSLLGKGSRPTRAVIFPPRIMADTARIVVQRQRPVTDNAVVVQIRAEMVTLIWVKNRWWLYKAEPTTVNG